MNRETNEALSLEPLKMEHLEQIYQIESLCFVTPWSMESLQSELANPLARYIVLCRGTEVLGYAGYWSIPPEGNITNVAIHPAVQGRGLSRIIMTALLEEARANGVKQVFLEVRTGNEVAQNLYRSFGFEAIDVRKGYYADTGEDALIMRLEQ